MTLNIEFWQLVTLLLAFFGFVGAVATVLLNQIDKRLDQRFLAMDEARKEADKSMQETIQQHTASEGKTADKVSELEKRFLLFMAELPIAYVRREDYVRKETVIEAKLDALFNLVATMKGKNP